MPGKRKARSLRARSGAAVSKNEMKRFLLHIGKVGTMMGGAEGVKRGKQAAKKRNKALKRRK